MDPTTDLTGTLQVLHARESIRTTLARYSWSGDFLLADAFAATFTDDATLEIKGMGAWRGRDSIRQAVEQGFGQAQEDRQRIARAGRFAHHVSSILIDLVDESHATSDSYFGVMGRDGADHWGRYRDRLEKVGDTWLFSHRRVSIDGWVPDSAFWPNGI